MKCAHKRIWSLRTLRDAGEPKATCVIFTCGACGAQRAEVLVGTAQLSTPWTAPTLPAHP